MTNPHEPMITDEASGVMVKNQRYLDWEAGARAERERLKALVEKEYPPVTTWSAWKKITGESGK